MQTFVNMILYYRGPQTATFETHSCGPTSNFKIFSSRFGVDTEELIVVAVDWIL